MPFAHGTLSLLRCSIQREVDQFRGGLVAGEVASGSDGAADFRVQGLNRVRSVDQPSHLGWVIEEGDHLVPGPSPARRDGGVFRGQLARLELGHRDVCGSGVHGGVDGLQGHSHGLAVPFCATIDPLDQSLAA